MQVAVGGQLAFALVRNNEAKNRCFDTLKERERELLVKRRREMAPLSFLCDSVFTVGSTEGSWAIIEADCGGRRHKLWPTEPTIELSSTHVVSMSALSCSGVGTHELGSTMTCGKGDSERPVRVNESDLETLFRISVADVNIIFFDIFRFGAGFVLLVLEEIEVKSSRWNLNYFAHS